MSEINKSKTIKCLGYCLVIYFYWGDPRREPTWESLTMISMSLLWPDDLNVPVLYCICFVTTDKGIHRHRNLLCFVKKEMLKTINQCTIFFFFFFFFFFCTTFHESFHLLSTKTLTFFEFISHINHFFYNIYTVIQLTNL